MFITDRDIYCYRVMPLGLKNARATYHRLINKMFTKLIGKTIEEGVCRIVDDMLVKSNNVQDHVEHLERRIIFSENTK